MLKLPPCFGRLTLYPSHTNSPIFRSFLGDTYCTVPMNNGDWRWSYFRATRHIIDSKYMIVLDYRSTASNVEFLGLDGSKKNVTAMPGATFDLSTNLILQGLQSENHRYLSLSTISEVLLIDMESLEIIWAKTLGTYQGTYRHRMDVSNDGTRAYIYDGYTSSIRAFNIQTGVELFPSIPDLFGSVVYYHNTTDMLYQYQYPGKMYKIDNTGASVLIADHGNYNSFSYEYWPSRSPDGRYLSVCMKTFDIETQTYNTAMDGIDNSTYFPIWLDERTYGIYNNGVEEAYTIISDAPYTTKVHKLSTLSTWNMTSDKYPWVGRYGEYEINVDIPQASTETSFTIEVFQRGYMIISQVVETYVSPLQIKVPTFLPVDVKVTPVKRALHSVDKYYSVGDKITVLDTQYIYECTTAGTTSLFKPAYPTTGSITDGTAVFLTKHKIANTVEHTHLVPTAI